MSIQSNDQKQWMHSIENIVSELKVFGANAFDDTNDVCLIAQTLLKLPEDIRTKVLDNVHFIVADNIAGTCFKISVSKQTFLSFIILNFAEMRPDSDIEKMRVIAHELAHFVIGVDHSNLVESDREKETNDLVQMWGFKKTNG